eukprot:1466665-Rhodomonas_salina.4
MSSSAPGRPCALGERCSRTASSLSCSLLMSTSDPGRPVSQAVHRKPDSESRLLPQPESGTR